jgi:hypothetical protein
MLRLAWMDAPLPSLMLVSCSEPSVPLLTVADTDRLPRLPPFFDDCDDDVEQSSDDFLRGLVFLLDGDDDDDAAEVSDGIDWCTTELRAGDESASGCAGRDGLELRAPAVASLLSDGAESETERRILLMAAASMLDTKSSGDGADGDGDGDEFGE